MSISLLSRHKSVKPSNFRYKKLRTHSRNFFLFPIKIFRKLNNYMANFTFLVLEKLLPSRFENSIKHRIRLARRKTICEFFSSDRDKNKFYRAIKSFEFHFK